MANDMWDGYLVVGGQMLRVGMHPDRGGGITEPVGRMEVKPGAQRLEWLEDAGCVVLYGEEQTVVVDKTLQQQRNLPPVIGVSHDGSLAFALDGPGPTHDVIVLPLANPDARPLRLANMDIARKDCTFVPTMDVVILVDGDPGTTVARNLLVIPLQQIREWIDEGATHADRGSLDYDVINGAKEFIPLDKPIQFAAVPDHPAFMCYWNVRTGGSITQGQIDVIEYLYWDKDASARGQVRQSSGPMPLDRFWLSGVMMERSPTGGLGVIGTGVSRKGGDFYLGLRTMAIIDPDEGVRYQMSQSSFDEHMFKEVELRNANSIREMSPLPHAGGVLLRVEDPYREDHLVRVDIMAASTEVTGFDLDVVPAPFCVVGERLVARAALNTRKEAAPKHQLTSGFTGKKTARVSLSADPEPDAEPDEPPPPPPKAQLTAAATPSVAEEHDDHEEVEEAEVIDDDIVEAEIIEEQPAAPARTASAPTVTVHTSAPPRRSSSAPPMAADAPAGGSGSNLVSVGGPVPVMPGAGLDLPVGVLPAQAHLAVSVVAVAPAEHSGLRWWLSQAQGAGDLIYKLHLRSDETVMVRYSVRRLA